MIISGHRTGLGASLGKVAPTCQFAINLKTAKMLGAASTPPLMRRSNRTCFAAVHESAFGTKRTFQSLSAMSAFGGKADIAVSRLLLRKITAEPHFAGRKSLL
jgi:hypothetical protein